MVIFNLDCHGALPALLDDATGKWLTYSELSQRVCEGAENIQGLGGKPLVFLFAGNNIAAATLYLAALQAGAAIALFPAGLGDERVAHLLEKYRPLIVFGAGVPDGYEGWGGAPLPGAVLRSRFHADLHSDLALLLPTSGSTGSSKLVRLSRSAVEVNAGSIAQALSISPEQRAGLNLPISYSYGLSVLNSHLLAGASVLLSCEGVLSRTWWGRLAEHGVSSMPGVPMVYEMLARLDFNSLAPSTLLTLTQAGGALSLPLIRRFQEIMSARQGKLYIMYGQTEATARISILDYADLPARFGSVGRAVAGGSISIRSVDGTAPAGEIVYKGPNVMLGYAETIEDLGLGDQLHGCLATGDLGVMDTEGFLTITGRLKRIVKIAGLRINLDEIEAEAGRICPVAAVERSNGLVVFAETGSDADVAELRRKLQESALVPPTLMKVQAIAKLPTMANGKIDLQALKDTL
jgi:acyl-CoA synthetase (AMP-forming)/AMP-acid ligase II